LKEEFAGAAEEFSRLAGLGEHGEFVADPGGVLTDAIEAGVGTGENEDGAGWLLTIHAGDEIEAVSLGHVDVAEEEIGRKAASTVHRFIGRVDGARDESMLLEDQTKCIGDEVFVIHYKNTTHLGEPLGRSRRSSSLHIVCAC